MSKSEKFKFRRITDHARELRKKMTPHEKLLWHELRTRRLGGYKILRQHPILYHGNLLRYNYFIADFYCAEKKAIIELDGSVHEGMKEYDDFRDDELARIGFQILRIKNSELDDIEAIKIKIISFLNSLP
jgi:leucyl-tRNA synthetase